MSMENGLFTLAKSVSETMGDSNIRQSHDCNCLGHIMQCDTDRIIPIYVVLPKVDKASKEG